MFINVILEGSKGGTKGMREGNRFNLLSITNLYHPLVVTRIYLGQSWVGKVTRTRAGEERVTTPTTFRKISDLNERR